METKREIISGGEIRGWPGYWEVKSRTEGDAKEWRALRKPDGSFYEVLRAHILPPSGGPAKMEIGEQIHDEKIIAYGEAIYAQLRFKKCSSCSAEVTYDGYNGCSVTLGKTADGFNLPTTEDPDLTVTQRWAQGICPCCTQPTLSSLSV